MILEPTAMTLSRYATISTFDIGTDIVTQITDGSVLTGISVFDSTGFPSERMAIGRKPCGVIAKALH
jgi:hypothetical protein